MSDIGGVLGDPCDDEAEYQRRPPGRRRALRQGGRGPGCLIALVILAVLSGGAYWGVTTGIDKIQDQFSSAEDYPGPGSGEVNFEVKQGDSIAEMGRGLKAAGVVASVEAFIGAAGSNAEADKIQPGVYSLEKEMKASAVVEVLVDPDNIVTTTVVIPEGFTVKQIVERLVKETDFKKAEFQAALKDPSLGLPDYAGGNAEGYLFPATYDFGPNEQPADMLRAMVDRWRQAAADVDLENQAVALGYTPHQIMTIASMLEAEGRGDYTPKIARVIYNRLEIEPNPSAGFLQIDATVNYALGRPGITRLTTEEIDSVADSPYNTYTHKGLPPGPIEAPGQAALEAALNPADGPWFYYVTVNLATGETKFATTPEEFQELRDELDEYCDTQSDRC